MPDETTNPAQPQPQPRPRRVDRKALRRLREPIRPQNISKRPQVYCWDCKRADENRRGDTCDLHASRWCSTCRSYISNAHDHEDYVGHPEVTDRFLDADLQWNWRPMALDARGLPQYDDDGGMWIYLTIGGVERLGYGKPGPGGVSELISNSLKSSGIRFGTALNQRAQTDLHAPDISSGSKACPHCKTSCDASARFCSNCGNQLLAMTATGSAPPAEPEYARPDVIARVNSMLARKRSVHGEDRRRELSEILKRDVDDVAHLSPEEARTVIRILSGTPDLRPATRAVAADPDPAAAEPPTEPAPTPDQPEPEPDPEQVPAPRRAAPGRRSSKPPATRPGKSSEAPAAPAAAGPGESYVRTIDSLLNSRGVAASDTPARMSIISAALQRAVGSLDELSRADAESLIYRLGSGEASVDPPPAAAAAEDAGPRGAFDELSDQISHAITEDDAQAIKVGIGKALTSGLITSPEGGTLYDRLENRGRQVGLDVAS